MVIGDLLFSWLIMVYLFSGLLVCNFCFVCCSITLTAVGMLTCGVLLGICVVFFCGFTGTFWVVFFVRFG